MINHWSGLAKDMMSVIGWLRQWDDVSRGLGGFGLVNHLMFNNISLLNPPLLLLILILVLVYVVSYEDTNNETHIKHPNQLYMPFLY